jgi:lipid-binding SYLF domain-containing protein
MPVKSTNELNALRLRCRYFIPFLGLAIFQVVKAGFVFSGKAGSGLVIARLPDGSWSAPSCIATGGVGWGLQIGADITDFVIVLNSEDAVRAFSMGGNVTIGGNISASAGPIGTGGSVQASLAHPAPMFSYSKSKGTLWFPYPFSFYKLWLCCA